MGKVLNKTEGQIVEQDEGGMRLDRWFKEHYSGLGFAHLQKLTRSGQIRIDGSRVKTNYRLISGQKIRIPPFLTQNKDRELKQPLSDDEESRIFLRSITLFEDDELLVINKPYGLSVQGGSGTVKHIDGLLASLTDKKGRKPRLVHRLDKDTSGCLLIAKKKSVASFLAKSFLNRTIKKTYWALLRGVPKPRMGKISTWLLKEHLPEGDKMCVVLHGTKGADHAITKYQLIETSGNKLSWVSLSPVSGRTHQLRIHTDHIGNPIIGDPKYFSVENWEMPKGIQNRLHLLAQKIKFPHPNGYEVEVEAPLPSHMQQSWNLLGFDVENALLSEDLNDY